jgi:uncharacterized cysteine cluster protein YcgN (CxxCxxCC family)
LNLFANLLSINNQETVNLTWKPTTCPYISLAFGRILLVKVQEEKGIVLGNV